MLQFIKSQPEVVPKLLLHMSTSAIMDLLLKIISMEEAQEGKGTVQVWLLYVIHPLFFQVSVVPKLNTALIL